ncbi:terminase gpA endonuclease subunit [Methylobacterium sp. WSM2598]|uniref:terminase gpA endonuclease subunit n=1 Tax=Methylobacterium sp. WSM2598 TaxID=398261 RepID=UPI0003A57DFA|nr:terminase gpA endonuclease subunit [Methylobacterium sp. WSM2598]
MTATLSAETLFAELFAPALRPPEPMTVAEWMTRNVVLIDGPAAGQTWSPDGAPYLVDIANCLSEDHPATSVTIRKSQQSGASILGLAWCLYIAARDPNNILYAVPGIDSLKQVAGQKLEPLIRAWQRHAGVSVIDPQTSRSGSGSTTFVKRFGDYAMVLGNANSAMDLSSKTIKYGVQDELSKWQTLQDGQNPENLFLGRFTAFRRRKTYKILKISTPEIDTGDETGATEGHCRIDREFLASDQRYWNIACPECQRLFVHDFARFRIDREHPHRSRYACNHCGHLISEAERVPAVRAGTWIPALDAPGRQPGFHIDGFISLMMSYEAIAEDTISAERGNERDRKDFTNLVLGRAYRFRGDAPDHRRLMERREAGLRRYHVPARGLLLCSAADVQMRGIWYEVAAFAPNGESWLIDCGYLEGDTEHPRNPVFRALRAATIDRAFPDAFGGTRRVDALAIDSGYRAHAVYAWVGAAQGINPLTGRDLVLAVKGVDGWDPPPIGTPSPVDIDLDGRKQRQGAKIWPVGTWSLKSSFYTNLHKLGIRSGEPADPPLLSRSGSDTVEVGALVDAELAAHADSAPGRITISGPKMQLSSQQMQTFALALHELTTNAVKYGALKGEVGRLSVTWERLWTENGGQRLALCWVESGVDVQLEQVSRRGYGRELIEQALAYALQARTEYALGDDGVHCRIELPLA